MLADDERDTLPPPPPSGNWGQELRTAFADVEHESRELMVLLGKLYARTAGLGACLVRLGHVISRMPKNDQ